MFLKRTKQLSSNHAFFFFYSSYFLNRLQQLGLFLIECQLNFKIKQLMKKQYPFKKIVQVQRNLNQFSSLTYTASQQLKYLRQIGEIQCKIDKIALEFIPYVLTVERIKHFLKFYIKLTEHKQSVIPILKVFIQGYLWKLDSRNESFANLLSQIFEITQMSFQMFSGNKVLMSCLRQLVFECRKWLSISKIYKKEYDLYCKIV